MPFLIEDKQVSLLFTQCSSLDTSLAVYFNFHKNRECIKKQVVKINQVEILCDY
jgi:hypothetical protein